MRHRSTLRSLIRGPRRCRCGHLAPCPTVVERGLPQRPKTRDEQLDDLPPLDFIETGRRFFEEYERRQGLRRNGGPR